MGETRLDSPWPIHSIESERFKPFWGWILNFTAIWLYLRTLASCLKQVGFTELQKGRCSNQVVGWLWAPLRAEQIQLGHEKKVALRNFHCFNGGSLGLGSQRPLVGLGLKGNHRSTFVSGGRGGCRVQLAGSQILNDRPT